MSKKTLSCGDVVPGCAWKAEAATEAELLAKVAEHAGHGHGIKDITPDVLKKVKAAIKDA